MAKRKLFEWETITNQMSRSNSGNCNFQYLSGLRWYLGKPLTALVHILTAPHRGRATYGAIEASNGTEPKYEGVAYAMYLFAQGSEDSITLKPYGPQLKEVIEAAGLGVVMDCGPAPNLMHNKKPGVLYVWKIDHAATKKWWEVNVHGEWKKREEAFKLEEAEENAAAKIKAEAAKAAAKLAQEETKAEMQNAEVALAAAGLADPLPKRKLRWRCRNANCQCLNAHEAVICAYCNSAKPAKLRRVAVMNPVLKANNPYDPAW